MGPGHGPGRVVARRRWLAGLVGLTWWRPTLAQTPGDLPVPASLPAEATAAARRGEPLVLMVSLPGCPFCEQVRRGHLAPLRQERGGVVQIDLGGHATVVDFDGTRRSHDAIARAHRVDLAPTLLFLDARGADLAERLVGYASADFYGAYLDQRLETARRALAGQR